MNKRFIFDEDSIWKPRTARVEILIKVSGAVVVVVLHLLGYARFWIFVIGHVLRDFGDELREIDKHEVIIKICQIIGSTPENLCKAEDVFNNIKYDITKYVMHHEYCSESKNQVKPKFLLWLDSKAEPKKARELSKFLDKYLK